MTNLLVTHTIIPPLSLSWWLGNLLSALPIIFILKFLKTKTATTQRKWEIGFFTYIILHIIVWQFYFIFSGTWTAAESLPLHLCDISRILGGFLILKFNQYLFEFILLLGVGAAIQSFLTPEIATFYSPLTHLDYYVSHGLIVFFGLYQFYVKGKRIRKKSWFYAFALGLLVMLLVGIFNYFSGGNYMFLSKKPIVENPLVIGDWPYYNLGFVGAGLGNILLSYWLFRWKKITGK